jgi:general secretion pathway protein K
MRPSRIRQALRLSHQATGSALLVALLTVALVAILASQAFWQEWRSIEVETADRSRLQAVWLLGGAHDWARARLRDDAQRSGAADHAGEEWAQPVAGMSLDGFLSGSATPEDPNVPDAPFLSQQLSDAQGKMNVLNLLEGQALSPLWLQAFNKLFEVLKLPPEQLITLTRNLQQASVQSAGLAGSVLLPQQSTQLVWLGLAPTTLDTLQAHVTLLPSRTPVNLNSASVEVLQSLLPSVPPDEAQRIVTLRLSAPFKSVADAGIRDQQGYGKYSVSSRYFELHTEIWLGAVSVVENALLQRDGSNVQTLWRRRGVAAENAAYMATLPLDNSP